jgi:phage/plasmid-like protein (TIGR03299 family)
MADEMPWHRFGTALRKVGTSQQAVRVAGLDWKVVIEPPHGKRSESVLIREDTATVLTRVKADYVPIQNLNVFRFFDAIVEATNASYESIGTAGNGRWVWMVARMKEQMEIGPGDEVGRFVLLSYKHGSPGPPTLSFRPVRLAGKNTFRDQLLYPLIKVRSTAQGFTELEDAPQVAAEKMAQHWDSLAQMFRLMLKIKIDEEGLQQYFESVFPKVRAADRGKYRNAVDRKRAIAKCIHLFVEGEGNDLPHARGSLWAAYSAITEYVDYYETEADDPCRLDGIWGSPLKNSAMARASNLVRQAFA